MKNKSKRSQNETLLSKHAMYALAKKMQILRQITSNLARTGSKLAQKSSCWADQAGKLNSGSLEVRETI